MYDSISLFKGHRKYTYIIHKNLENSEKPGFFSVGGNTVPSTKPTDDDLILLQYTRISQGFSDSVFIANSVLQQLAELAKHFDIGLSDNFEKLFLS